MKKTESLVTQFWVIIYAAIEFRFSEKKNRNGFGLILGNNLHNQPIWF